jgi:hypothetical protein
VAIVVASMVVIVVIRRSVSDQACSGDTRDRYCRIY